MRLRAVPDWTTHGRSSTDCREDLWDLSVEGLDEIYKNLRAEQKTTSEESLLNLATDENTILGLRIDIVKHVVQTKLSENDARKVLAENRLQKHKIAGIIAEKKDAGLRDMSVEDLQKAMDSLA